MRQRQVLNTLTNPLSPRLLSPTVAADAEQTHIQRRTGRPVAQLQAERGGQAGGVCTYRSGTEAGHNRQG